jgi:hypothetical protein
VPEEVLRPLILDELISVTGSTDLPQVSTQDKNWGQSAKCCVLLATIDSGHGPVILNKMYCCQIPSQSVSEDPTLLELFE